MNPQERAFERYAARVGAHWTAAQRAEARRGYLDGLSDVATDRERARNGECYYVPLTDYGDASEGDSLYLDEEEWAAHMASFHGKPVVLDEPEKG